MKDQIISEALIEIGNPIQRHILKVPYTVTDDYGNMATLFRKEIISEDDLLEKRAVLQKEIEEIDERLRLIQKI